MHKANESYMDKKFKSYKINDYYLYIFKDVI